MSQRECDRPAWEPVLLGDWTTLIRGPLDLLRLSFAAGAAVFAFDGNFGIAALLAITFAVALVPRLLELPRPFDLAFLLAMSLQAWGNASSLFSDYGWYDTFVHFLLTLLATPVVYLALARLEVLPHPSADARRHQYVGVFIVAWMLGLGLEALNEIYEFSSDHLLGTALQAGNVDTVTDLMASAVGAAIGAGLMVLWVRFGWTTTRRLPARQLGDFLHTR
jgi:hypothetical protein